METAQEFQDMRLAAENACKAWLASVKSGKSMKVTSKKEEELKAAIDAYNKAKTDCQYEALAATDKPFESALKTRLYGGMIKVKVDRDDSGLVTDASVVDSDALIQPSLQRLDKLCESGSYGAVTDWHRRFCAMRLPLCAAATKEVDGDMSAFKNAYAYTADTIGGYNGRGSFSLKEELDDNLSIGSTLEMLQDALDGVIFEPTPDNPERNMYRANKCDARYIRALMRQEGKTGQVVMPKQETIDRLVTRAISRIFTDGSYDLEYTEKK